MPLRAPTDVASRRPRRPFAAVLGLALASLAPFVTSTALAQDGTSQLAPLDADTRVLPVWSNASGRVEALLLLDPSQELPASSLDRVLRTTTPALGLGSRVQLDGGAELRSSLQLDGDAGLALLCEGRRGLAGTLGALGERCLLAMLGHDDPLLQGDGRGVRLDFGWQSPGRDVDLSFGLSWLDYTPPPAALLASAAFGRGAGPGSFDALAWWQSPLESRGLHLDSLIKLGPQARMLFGGDIGRSQLLGIDGRPLRWESASLSFGLGFGDFTGELTGRLVELPRGGEQWSTLDIGVSWRTPWRGELSVGARNVLGADTSAWPLAELPAIEDPSARIPYVRYQQDL